MNLLDSLLDAITRLEGEALVMHVGEKPYVVTTSSSMYAFRGPLAWGQVELSTRVLTSEAVLGMLGQILPLDQRQGLEEYGAVEYEIHRADNDGERFTVIAARGGDDVWLEVRRRHARAEAEAVQEPEVPEAEIAAAFVPGHVEEDVTRAVAEDEAIQPQAEDVQPQVDDAQLQAEEEPVEIDEGEQFHVAESQDLPEDEETYELRAEEFAEPAAALTPEPVDYGESEEEPEQDIFDISAEDVAPLEEAGQPVASEWVPDHHIEIVPEVEQSVPTSEEVDAMLAAAGAALLESAELDEAPVAAAAVTEQIAEPMAPRAEEPPVEEPMAPRAEEPPVEEPMAPRVEELPVAEPMAPQAGEPPVAEPMAPRAEEPPVEEPTMAPRVEEPPVAEPMAPRAEEPPVEEPVASRSDPAPLEEPVPAAAAMAQPAEVEELRSAVILPISRGPVRPEPAAQAPAALIAPLEHMLRVAAARGASTVYVVANSKPMIRVDGEISVLDAEAVFAASDVDRVVMELAPARGRDGNQPVEWMSDVPEVGRVRCVTFRDHRGPGIIFRMIPPRAISAEQLGLSAEVQALCAQPDGLVLVTGPRASGKSTLLSAFVDLINRTRSDHVITIESQIGFVHESRRSFVSQREVRGDSETAVATVRSAFREDPDVLVIEDLRTPEIVTAALEAAESGRLVFGSLPAPSTVAAIERLVELLPADRRSQAQSSLAASLRGVVAQMLLRKVKGGRIAAREVLLNTPSVADLIADGTLFQLPVALESGRRQGMVPFNESLASLVREGTVHVAEAYRKALDREALLALFKRDGTDTSFAERLA